MTCSDIRIVLVTCPSTENAREISNNIVQAKLAACVNIIPAIQSIFFWEGKIEESSECLLLIKTVEDVVSELEAAIQKLHPYSTPEFLVLEAAEVGKKYHAWVRGYLERKN